VGKPMDVPLIPEPSREQIAEYHRKYIQCLRELFDENNAKYGQKDLKLEIK